MKDVKVGLALVLSIAALSACSEVVDEPTTCNYTVPKCNADGTAILLCQNGVETSTPCQCSNGACASQPTGQTCDYTGSKCNATGTALLTCQNGTENTTPCNCVNNQCSAQQVQPDKCTYTGSKCNSDGTALLTCNDGVESSKPCSCAGSACIETANKNCDYTGSKCNSDGTALLTCNDGTETSLVCSCANNACVTSPSQGCTYSTPKCNADGTALLTCTDGVESSTACTCVNDACTSQAEKCTYTDTKCNSDNTAMLTCTDGVEHSVSCQCENGQCKSNPTVSCDYEGSKCNSDNTALLTCIDGTEASKKCECADNKCKEDAPAIPKVANMMPSSGQIGTTVTITGTDLDKTTEVCFAAKCIAPASKKTDAVSVNAPEGSGDVQVKLIVGDHELIAGTFSYIIPEPNTIDWCQLKYVQPSVTPDALIQAYAEVAEQGITGKDNKHEGIFAQMGYIDADSKTLSDVNTWSWINATLNKQFQGESVHANDEYMNTTLKLAAGKYRIAFRFSLDEKHWTYCDYNGSNSAFKTDKTGLVTVAKTPEPPAPTVSKCYITNAESSIKSTTGNATEPVYAMGKVEACTSFDKHCADLDVEIGYGAKYLSSTSEIASSFTWKKAVQDTSYDGSQGKDMERFAATLTSTKAGEFNILYRMSADKGKNWTYCDRLDDVAFSAKDGIAWTVTDAANPDPKPEKSIEWCKIWSPDEITVRANHESEEVYGRVLVNDCTGTTAGCSDLKAQFGYGPKSKKASEFTYVDAEFNPLAYEAGNNDEFAAAVTPTKAGEYAYAYRFSLNGKDWTYCDTQGIMGSDLSKAGKMTVEEDIDKISWCRVQHPKHIDAQPNVETEEIYGQVFVDGCTGKPGAKCPSIVAQVGYGDATLTDQSKFQFVDAEYNLNDGDNDEYYATLTPTEAGNYRVIYRFSTDNKKTWTYCDYADDNQFSLANASTMTVQEKSEMEISWCQFFTTEFKNDTVKTIVGTDSAPIYGQAFVQNCTEPDGQCAHLTAYIGYGDKNAASPEDYTFVPVSYIKNVDVNDEFVGTVNIDKAGEYGLVYAFSLDGGKTKTFCGNKDKNEFSMSDIALINVLTEATQGPKMVSGQDYSCHIDNHQASIEGPSGTPKLVFGQVYIPGCTQGNRCDRVVSSHFHYIPQPLFSSNDIATSSRWNIVDATFNPYYSGPSNNEYMANVTFDSGTYNYAFSFDLKHDASDLTEKPQRVFCLVDGQFYGTANIFY